MTEQLLTLREEMRETLSRLVSEKNTLVGRYVFHDVSPYSLVDGNRVTSSVPVMLSARDGTPSDAVRSVAELVAGRASTHPAFLSEVLLAHLIRHPEAFAEITNADTALSLAMRCMRV